MQQNKEFSPLGLRLLATFLNTLVMSFPSNGIIFLVSFLLRNEPHAMTAALLWAFLAVFVYLFVLLMFIDAYFISRFGGTLGKLIFGLSVEHKDGSRLSFRRALFRENIAKIVVWTSLGLGFFWALRNPERQGWHDMLSDSYVVRREKNALLPGLAVLILLLIIHALFIYGIFLALTLY